MVPAVFGNLLYLCKQDWWHRTWEAGSATRLPQEADSPSVFLWRNRPDLLKALGALLLERICLAEQGLPGEHRDSKAEKALQQVAVQLRDELGHSVPASSFSKSHNECKSLWGSWLVKTADEATVELKSVSVQTMTIEDTPHGVKPERKRDAWAEEPEGAVFSTERESEALGEMPGLQATHLSFPSAINTVSFSVC